MQGGDNRLLEFGIDKTCECIEKCINYVRSKYGKIKFALAMMPRMEELAEYNVVRENVSGYYKSLLKIMGVV